MGLVKKKYSAICPICERTLFKGYVADIDEFGCPKCKAKLSVVIKPGSVQVRETEFKPDAKRG